MSVTPLQQKCDNSFWPAPPKTALLRRRDREQDLRRHCRHHPDQLVDQMAIYLEESPPLTRYSCCWVRYRIAVAPNCASGFASMGASSSSLLREAKNVVPQFPATRASAPAPSAPNPPGWPLVRKRPKPANSHPPRPRTAQALPPPEGNSTRQIQQPRHHPIDQRRTDGHSRTGEIRASQTGSSPRRTQGPHNGRFCRSGVELRCSAYLQSRPVAIVPRRRSMQPNLGGHLNFRNPPQSLAQDSSLELQLSLIRNVLVMASAALPEVRTARLDAIGEARQLRHRAAREAGFSCRRSASTFSPGKTNGTKTVMLRPSGQAPCGPDLRRRRSVFRWKAASRKCSARTIAISRH